VASSRDTMSEVTRPVDERLVAAWRGVLGASGTQTISKLPFGTVWSITTASGRRFVLKRLADADLAKRRHRFTEETRIVVHLGQHGVPVAVPILSDDGRISIEHDGALWALTPMLPMPEAVELPTAETVVQENAESRIAVGRAIAEMHLALADCPYGIDGGIISPETFVEYWDRLGAELPVATFESLRQRVDRRREQISAALTCSPPQRLHGDCHGGNILVRDGRVTGIVDIDHLHIGPRVYDLAYHLAFHVQWIVRTDTPDVPAEAAVSLATRLLLDGYASVSPLSEAEHAAVAPAALYVALRLVASFIGNTPEEDVWARIACWIADHEETLHPDGGGVRR
jgi:Ser/Thr protein kinase RdoA (MazF antagonist)